MKFLCLAILIFFNQAFSLHKKENEYSKDEKQRSLKLTKSDFKMMNTIMSTCFYLCSLSLEEEENFPYKMYFLWLSMNILLLNEDNVLNVLELIEEGIEEKEAFYKVAHELLEKYDEYSLKIGRIFLKIAAKDGHVNALYDYGFMLLFGRGGSINNEEAIGYIKLAADYGHLEAQYQYALLCLTIKNPKNLNEALYYLKLSADNGHPHGQYRYGFRLYNGDGIEQNITEAKKYFLLAIEQDHKGAKDKYEEIIVQEKEMMSKVNES